jgi:putative transposase
MITNRPRRLDGVSYVGLQRYFLTTCTAFRRPVFTDAVLVTEVVDQLLQNAAKFQFALTAYCLMPDHIHVLLEAQSDASDFTAFARRFKQVTGFRYTQKTRQPLWQPGYHEHILRDDEVTEAVARYIFENPIRAGLSQSIGEYPFAGSAVYEMKELMTLWERLQA